MWACLVGGVPTQMSGDQRRHVLEVLADKCTGPVYLVIN